MIIPAVTIGGVLFGSIVRAFWGWLNSGEKFNWRKFSSTLIPSIFAASAVGASMMSADIIITGSGIITLAITALLAGWGIDDGMKQISNMKK